MNLIQILNLLKIFHFSFDSSLKSITIFLLLTRFQNEYLRKNRNLYKIWNFMKILTLVKMLNASRYFHFSTSFYLKSTTIFLLMILFRIEHYRKDYHLLLKILNLTRFWSKPLDLIFKSATIFWLLISFWRQERASIKEYFQYLKSY